MMAEWECPQCARIVRAIATVVEHRCPGNRLKATRFVRVDEAKS